MVLDGTPPPPAAAATLRAFQVVVAATRDLGIGKEGKLPWSVPSDMAFFKRITSEAADARKKNAVVMGRRTWESIPAKFRPLPGRVNVVLSRAGLELGDKAIVCSSLDSALGILAAPPFDSSVEAVFVIGGGEVFREAMVSPLCTAIHLTEIQTFFECDTFMPALDLTCFRLWYASSPATVNNVRHSFHTYVRNKALDVRNVAGTCSLPIPEFVRERHEEYQYLNLIKDIIETGNTRSDRTGTGTISKFGCQMRFNLRNSFPLLTTKRVFWRGVVEELLWFISGSTNAKVLEDKGIHIWKGNGSREYLDSIGLSEREENDLGPVYGFQWRHFGARYSTMHDDYTGQGVDQLAEVIDKIKNKPDDRRIVLSSWNPADLKQMALPPCHMFAQFYVSNGELSCQMYQRSCDMGLGVPFNIASYALLTCMIAHVCDLAPGDFVHVLGDAHVYTNHVDPLKEQLENVPKPFPILKIATSNKDIDSFTAKDFQLVDYESHQRIAMKMAL
ncbi:hypothetical protein SELMODRAFT_404548 [Selaginella moellendorffii]|uniref:Bifunctional dihydrofolate reductase-thymidylate synthase n=1 Tax=Selaginella moellendorffii TaxID=88036 RepID=D8QVP4_SELML|nr:bifunctional dihydrofolate reductase-thymidylate synthase [Selaginella moellendorffii]EFJ36491.1 hypothetical protein SELMODRAFT_404548 [Selaginella moellendorffii]|eukprot:XP_002963028.1 bifunctional dihydrofolate reductase-thymidylate synthase [Selaginella moellendorffii]